MKIQLLPIRLSVLLLGLVARASNAQLAATTLTIHVDKTLHPISPTLNGIFFEDINFGADGGLYPERVKNGSFEFSPDPMLGWHKIETEGGTGQIAIASDQPLNPNNPHFLRLNMDANTSPAAGFGLSNDGFRGMGVAAGAKFNFSAYGRVAGKQTLWLKIELQDHENKTIGSATLSGFTADWTQRSVALTSTETDEHAHLVVTLSTPGSIDLDMISLFPQETWQNRPHGLRPDLVQLLKDMHPKFMRFPGGCIVEGRFLENRYQWKTTIGDPAARKLIVDRWNTEFAHRQTPDYFQSFGLGFFEYFQLCEDIGASPLPILNCGMACQFNSSELAPLDGLDPYIQDALDLVEFANGPVDSEWGKKRAMMGHPAPFDLKMMGVGNEQWGPHYIERFQKFQSKLKSAYPDIKLISAAGPFPEGPLFDFGWKQLTALHADIIDEHYYESPGWFPENAHRYDHYPRTGPKVFAGEFAAQSVATVSPKNRNNWQCALSEAAFMTGLERNSDLVVMSSYAPLFAHVDAWQWTPNLIWFNNNKSFGSPSYYVQKLFSTNAGTDLLDTETSPDLSDLFFATSKDQHTGDIIVKIVNLRPGVLKLPDGTEQSGGKQGIEIVIDGTDVTNAAADEQVLSSRDLAAENTLDNPTNISPISRPIGKNGKLGRSQFMEVVEPRSVTVVRIHPSH